MVGRAVAALVQEVQQQVALAHQVKVMQAELLLY
jgi:hypothetical protein